MVENKDDGKLEKLNINKTNIEEYSNANYLRIQGITFEENNWKPPKISSPL